MYSGGRGRGRGRGFSIGGRGAGNSAGSNGRGAGGSTGRNAPASAPSAPSISNPNTPVSVGEYCTLVRAKDLGILNTGTYKNSTTNSPFGDNYNDLKTFNSTIDNRDKRTQSLCKTVIQGADPSTATTEAFPFCIDVKGPGFIKRADTSADTPFKCQAYDCPPGFTSTGEFCNKEPTYKDAMIDKRSRCDERWYDWFMLPNYHLGNKYYEQSVGKCFVPCPDHYVPYFAKDPVDDSKVSLLGEDQLTKCVPRNEYFVGKYAKGSDYCPLAWVFRLYTCNKDHAKELIQQRHDHIQASNSNYTTTIFANMTASDNVDKEAMYISQQSQRLLENVEFPKDSMMQACNTLNTKERLDQAYNICNKLKTEGTINLVGGADASGVLNANRNEVLRQACNAVFCNEEVGALDVIGKDPICFEKAKQIDPSSAVTMSEEAPSSPQYTENQKFFYRSFTIMITIIVFTVLGMIGYIVFTRFIWPNIRRTFYRILGVFTGKRYAYVEYKAQAMEELAKARSRAAAAMST